jgi:hypothetical protein
MNAADLAKVQAKLPLSRSTLAKNLPPPAAADASAELGPATSREDQPGRERGSHSKKRAAAALSCHSFDGKCAGLWCNCDAYMLAANECHGDIGSVMKMMRCAYSTAKRVCDWWKENEQHEDQTDTQLPDAEPERDYAPALGAAVQGEAACVGGTVVRFVGYRVRPLDPDNFAASCKGLLDGLRHAQIISGDEPWRITLQTEQVKVKHRKDEKTVVEIIT